MRNTAHPRYLGDDPLATAKILEGEIGSSQISPRNPSGRRALKEASVAAETMRQIGVEKDEEGLVL